MNCDKCQAEMQPLLFSFFCPNDCDKVNEVESVSSMQERGTSLVSNSIDNLSLIDELSYITPCKCLPSSAWTVAVAPDRSIAQPTCSMCGRTEQGLELLKVLCECGCTAGEHDAASLKAYCHECEECEELKIAPFE